MGTRLSLSKLQSATARAKLPPRGRAYFALLDPSGVHVGVRRGKRASAWVVRVYLGAQVYAEDTLGPVAEEDATADGRRALSFRQACERARQRARELRSAHDDDEDEYPAGGYLVRHAVRDYLEAQRAAGKRAVDDAETRANALILPKLGNIEVARLTTKRLRRWLAELAETPARLRTKAGVDQRFRALDPGNDEAVRRRRASANRTWTILRAALNLAYAERRTGDNEAWTRVKPFAGADAARERYLSLDEARRLINAAGEFRPMIEAALFTGARYSELARLRARDFNPDAGTVYISRSKAGRARDVPLSSEGARFFQHVTAGLLPDDLIFRKRDGSPWRHAHQHRPMRAACARAEIHPACGFHTLRHTYASHAVMNGAALQAIAKALGHTDTRMVEKHYGHLAPSWLANAVRQAVPTFDTDPSASVP